MFWKKKKDIKIVPQTHFDNDSPKRVFLRSVYNKVIRPKYQNKGYNFFEALPEVILDLIEADKNYEHKDK